MEITAEGFENSKRKTVLIKVRQAYLLFKEMIQFYGISHLIKFMQQGSFKTIADLLEALPNRSKRDEWLNIGGQLMNTVTVDALKQKVKSGKIKSWDGLHDYYTTEAVKYEQQKLQHALASLVEINNIKLKKLDSATISSLLNKAVTTKEWMANSILKSREKDYNNPYRKMVYDTQKEMENVIGKLKDNSFIQHQLEEAVAFKKEITSLKRKLK